MQVSYEKRRVRLQRQAGEDASGSASDARAILTYRSLPQTVCCNKGLCNRASLKVLAQPHSSPRLNPGSTSPWSHNNKDKSRWQIVRASWCAQHASPQGAPSFFSGGLTFQQICTHLCSHGRLQTLINEIYVTCTPHTCVCVRITAHCVRLRLSAYSKLEVQTCTKHNIHGKKICLSVWSGWFWLITDSYSESTSDWGLNI